MRQSPRGPMFRDRRDRRLLRPPGCRRSAMRRWIAASQAPAVPIARRRAIVPVADGASPDAGRGAGPVRGVPAAAPVRAPAGQAPAPGEGAFLSGLPHQMDSGFAAGAGNIAAVDTNPGASAV